MTLPRLRGVVSVVHAWPLLLLLAGCTGGSDSAPDPASAGSVAAGSAAVGLARFAIDQDFPDPDVLVTDHGYLAFATNSALVNVQVASSSDLMSWRVESRDALPILPAWTSQGRVWAPEVSAIGGRYVLYFTAKDSASGRQCVGVAVASEPEGPYDSPAPRPLVCPVEEGGAIDASTFVDEDGSAFLLYKTDGNCCGKPTRIELARLSTDGTALAGTATELIRQTRGWEGRLVEAPTLVRREGRYVLFYSANDYAGVAYAIGYATADAVGGPYTKADGPFVSTESSALAWLGPGGQDIVTAPDGTDRLVFHSWDPAVRYRGVNVASLSWKDGKPTLAYPAR